MQTISMKRLNLNSTDHPIAQFEFHLKMAELIVTIQGRTNY